MVRHTAPDDLSAYSAFNIYNAVYKTIGSRDIRADILIPKAFTPPPTGAPVLFRFHGGGLGTGSGLTPLFFATYLLDLATKHSAIIVCPNYRLLPEANARDILEDAEDSWKWLHSNLASYLSQQTNDTVKPDLTRVMVTGDSSGGYLALQTALSHPDIIRAVTVTYPMVDMKNRWYNEAFHKQLMEFPQLPLDMVDKHIAAMAEKAKATGGQEGLVRSEDLKLESVTLLVAFFQHGLYAKYFDASDAAQYPLERLARGERLPKGGVLVMHATGDSVVPIEHSRTLAQVVKQHDPSANFTLCEREGDHGFETEVSLTEPWLAEALAPVLRSWLE